MNPININSKNISSLILIGTISLILLIGYAIGLIVVTIIRYGLNTNLIILGFGFIIILVPNFYYLSKITLLLVKREKISDRLLEEQVVKEIVEQDFKLMQMQIMEREHNMKVKEWNKINPEDKLNTFKWRGVDSIANQAFDSNFYGSVFGARIMKKKKR